MDTPQNSAQALLEHLGWQMLRRDDSQNLAGSNCRIKKVMMDRGFLSGRAMWWLDSQGIYFVCPARKDMMVAKHARSLALDGQGYVQQRQRQVQHGHGKARTTEVLSTEVAGITGLNTWETYNDPSQLQFRDNRGYRPASINAVVVRQWDNKDVGLGSWVVYLTNQPVTKPLTIFDDYDSRSIIENSLFREAKQAWSLEAIPKQTQRAAVAHIFITFTVMALASAYRTWKERDEAEESYSNLSLKPVGVRRWRRQLKAKTQDRVIAFADGYYGIFHVAEFTVLTGFTVRVLPQEVGSVKDIYLRYGLSPPEE